MDLKDRFLKYVSFDTQADESSSTFPSTEKQLVLLRYLKEELETIGLKEVTMDEHGYVMGTLPATKGCENAPVIGFISHVDTAPDMSGANVKPHIVENYDGRDIKLGGDVWLRVEEFPELPFFKGHTLIHTDGTTLLGADDKAGVAEIFTACEFILNHPEINHGKIAVCITPDEEIGCGADHFDVEKFGAKWAYTVDGGELAEIEYENFNAAGAKVTVHGNNVHPGMAKDIMVNAQLLAMEYAANLPADETPATTEGYEGFFHLTNMEGNVESAKLQYIIRDHSREGFEARKALILVDKIKEELEVFSPSNLDKSILFKKIIYSLTVLNICVKIIIKISIKLTP